MSAGTQPEQTAATEPESISLGPSRPPLRRRTVVGLLVLVVVIAAGGLGWKWYAEASNLVTAAELQASYDAMITTDGRASTGPLLPATSSADDRPQTAPERCAAVTDATVRRAYPTGAVQGLISYQGGSMDFATGLLSYRFASTAQARTEFARVDEAINACVGTTLSISEPWSIQLDLQRLQTQVPQAQDAADVLLQPGVVPSSDGSGRASYQPSYELTVARYKNVLSWQYSYRSGQGQPDPDHELLDTLSRRLVAVDRGEEPGTGGR